MSSITSASIDLHTQRAAIDALDAQRAAYRRMARLAEAQQGALAGGDVEQVAAFTEGAVQDIATLHEGALRTRAAVDEASSSGASEVAVRELERRMDEMMREARSAEVAIRNLATQLEAWRDEFGRQLADRGVMPGGSGDDAAPRPSYGAPPAPPPRLLDRRG